MQKITKALIIMAGKGTRALPATKVVAKELFPVGNKPALMFLLEECIQSGIEEVVIVISRQKREVIKFLKSDRKLEKLLEKYGKLSLLSEWINIVDHLKIKFVYQGRINGGGGAVMSAKKHFKKQPFLLVIADDLFICGKNQRAASKEVIDCFNKTGKFVVGALEIPDERVPNYGIIKIGNNVGDYIEVKGFVEKPKLGDNPSNLASLARYVLLPKIFDNLKKCEKHQNGEIFIPDAIEMECENNNVVACKIHSKYFDLGNSLEYVKCVIETSLKDKMMGEKLEEYLKNLVKSFE